MAEKVGRFKPQQHVHSHRIDGKTISIRMTAHPGHSGPRFYVEVKNGGPYTRVYSEPKA